MTEKLKIGILDLLTILLPGGFLLACLSRIGGLSAAFTQFFADKGQSEWRTFAILAGSAYVLGHFIYFIASWLDTWLYENVARVFWNDRRLAAYILKLKSERTGIDDRGILNAFKWSCAWLLMNQASMYAEVERHVAESKFFRSLVIVAFLSSLILIVTDPHQQWRIAIVLLFLAFLSSIRYLTQRKKSIETAYTYVITATETAFDAHPDPIKLSELTRANIRDVCPPGVSKYEIRRSRLLWSNITCFSKKFLKLLQLCLNPWYKREIAPQGNPSYTSKEMRWFFREEQPAMEEWFRRNMNKTEEGPTTRTDTYYYQPGMTDIGIKFRGSAFEIKQQIPSPGRQTSTHTLPGELQYWNKWILKEEDGLALKRALTARKYHTVDITKIRWALKLTLTANGVPSVHSAGENMQEGCQLEYTRLRLLDQNWCSFSFEWFGDGFIAPEKIIAMGLPELTGMHNAGSMSYPAFVESLTAGLTTGPRA